MLVDKIAELEERARQAIAAAVTIAELDAAETLYLGRKGELNEILKGIKDLADEEKPIVGPRANATKQALAGAITEARERIERSAIDWDKEWIDVSAPGERVPVGHLHPITILENEIVDIFAGLGFTVADGPEVESEWYNFDALNMPADHPARDMQDTFWLTSEKKWTQRYLMRTHTSPVQVRYMETHKPPIRIVVPGRIFRNEATDASHEHTFHQFECLMVEGGVSVATFKYVAQLFFERFFGQKVDIRLRPSFFPFTEPSFEFDISCIICGAKGCPVCKQSGWLEIGGAGMVNQKVFEAAGYKRGAHQGFAWGFGTTRLAMMKYKISDIRLLMSGDIRFISQF
jgi:phenylalanyl-tRNA synthetase alpha chain